MVCLLKVVFSSHTVTATILVPLIIALGKPTGMDVTAITPAAALTSSLAFILVTTTPANVFPFNTGYFNIGDMAKTSHVLPVVASLVIALVFTVFGGLRGPFRQRRVVFSWRSPELRTPTRKGSTIPTASPANAGLQPSF